MSTLKITVKKSELSPLSDMRERERVIVGALCCVINGHTTTTTTESLVLYLSTFVCVHMLLYHTGMLAIICLCALPDVTIKTE